MTKLEKYLMLQPFPCASCGEFVPLEDLNIDVEPDTDLCDPCLRIAAQSSK
jgi:hypothetical protein